MYFSNSFLFLQQGHLTKNKRSLNQWYSVAKQNECLCWSVHSHRSKWRYMSGCSTWYSGRCRACFHVLQYETRTTKKKTPMLHKLVTNKMNAIQYWRTDICSIDSSSDDCTENRPKAMGIGRRSCWDGAISEELEGWWSTIQSWSVAFAKSNAPCFRLKSLSLNHTDSLMKQPADVPQLAESNGTKCDTSIYQKSHLFDQIIFIYYYLYRPVDPMFFLIRCIWISNRWFHNIYLEMNEALATFSCSLSV